MGKADEKFMVVLQLLNTCRQKLDSLCNLFRASVVGSKQDSAELGRIFEQAVDCENELKLLNPNKGSKLVVKSIKTRLTEAKKQFADMFESFSSRLKDCMPLREEYKKEVVMCCDTYKKMKTTDELNSIEKGYRQQVKLIQKILQKIKEYIAEYKAEKLQVEDKKARFDKTCSKVENLVSTLG